MHQPEGIGSGGTSSGPSAPPFLSPEQLMVGYQAGHPSAAAALVRTISPLLIRLFAADTGSRSHADDLLQETWLRIHKARHTYRPGDPVLPWFYAIARYVRIDHYRHRLRTTVHEESLSDTAEVAATPSEFTRPEELDGLLAPLSPSEREVLEMLKVVGMSLEEVARATSTTIGSVKQKVHRAYQKLRRLRDDSTEGRLRG